MGEVRTATEVFPTIAADDPTLKRLFSTVLGLGRLGRHAMALK